MELVTPTGALLVSAYARGYGAMPAMTVERTGYGAGTRELTRQPNVLRVVIGERSSEATAAAGTESVVKIECEIDDMSPQLFGPAERPAVRERRARRVPDRRADEEGAAGHAADGARAARARAARCAI